MDARHFVAKPPPPEKPRGLSPYAVAFFFSCCGCTGVVFAVSFGATTIALCPRLYIFVL